MPTNTALLIIDVQMAMFSEKDPVYLGETLLTRIKDLDVLATPQIIAHHNQVLEGWFVKLKSSETVEI